MIDIRNHGGSYASGKYRKGVNMKLAVPIHRNYQNLSGHTMLAVDSQNHSYGTDGYYIYGYKPSGERKWAIIPQYLAGGSSTCVIVGDWVIGWYINSSGKVMYYRVKKDGTSPFSEFPAFGGYDAGNVTFRYIGNNEIIAHRSNGSAGYLEKYTVNPTTGVITSAWSRSVSNFNITYLSLVTNLNGFSCWAGSRVEIISIATGSTIWQCPVQGSQQNHFADNNGNVYLMTGSGPYTANKILYQGSAATWTKALHYGYIIGGTTDGLIATAYPGTQHYPVVTQYDASGNILWESIASQANLTPVKAETLDRFIVSGNPAGVEYVTSVTIE